MNDNIYKCNDCHWEGQYEQLDFDKVDTCFGADLIEICPQCGSNNLVKKQVIDHETPKG